MQVLGSLSSVSNIASSRCVWCISYAFTCPGFFILTYTIHYTVHIQTSLWIFMVESICSMVWSCVCGGANILFSYTRYQSDTIWVYIRIGVLWQNQNYWHVCDHNRMYTATSCWTWNTRGSRWYCWTSSSSISIDLVYIAATGHDSIDNTYVTNCLWGEKTNHHPSYMQINIIHIELDCITCISTQSYILHSNYFCYNQDCIG